MGSLFTVAKKFVPKKVRKLITQNTVQETGLLITEDEYRPRVREACSFLLEAIGEHNFGDYLEFGVFNGSSLSIMHDTLDEFKLNNVRLFGFDSFEGLPETAKTDDEGVWKPGQFRCNLKTTRHHLSLKKVDWNRTFLVKGWFSKTLNSQTKKKYKIQKASLIMVDCDMYQSTCEVLSFCAPLILDKVIIIFDDWNSYDLAERNLGEKKAFDEFLQANPHLRAEEFGNYSHNGQPNGKLFLVTNTRANGDKQ